MVRQMTPQLKEFTIWGQVCPTYKIFYTFNDKILKQNKQKKRGFQPSFFWTNSCVALIIGDQKSTLQLALHHKR